MSPIPPGKTLGILGGGQLGRMIALAARPLGYRVHVLDREATCAAAPVVERVVAGGFDDVEAARTLARGVDVMTLEIEHIDRRSLEAVAKLVPLRPGVDLVAMVQDRAAQKKWLKGHGFPLAPFWLAESAEDLASAVTALGAGCFVKTTRGGYDGRGQARLSPGDDMAAAWRSLGGVPCIVEQAVRIERELSVLVARRPGGEVAVYEPAQNHHERQILLWSVLPAPVPAEVRRRAMELGKAVADAAALEGLLTIEMFLAQDGALLVNELAPRVHNSYHASEVACLTSQFEQAVRAACDLPLGSPEVVRPAAIHNLLGDVWHTGEPDFTKPLSQPGVRLVLYGKGEPRPARKMGHLVASAPSPDEAVQRVLSAYAALKP